MDRVITKRVANNTRKTTPKNPAEAKTGELDGVGEK